MEIFDDMILNIGEAHVIVNFLSADLDDYEGSRGSENNRIKIRIFGGPADGQVFTFSDENKEILIGRTQQNHIKIEDKLLSKVQCSISFNDGCWIL